MSSTDEINAYINLCKWSVLDNRYTEKKFNSYDENFEKYGLLFKNNSWEFAIYNKQAQIEDTCANLSNYNNLLYEAHNIVRIEFRCKSSKLRTIKKHSTSVVDFLDEDLATTLLNDIYNKNIGYQDFYREYYAKKKLAEEFPPTVKEQRQGIKHGKKYMEYLEFMKDIMNHKGMNNALKSCLSGLPEPECNRERLRFKRRIKKIQALGMSPVMIPNNWIYGEKSLNLPSEKFTNPLLIE